MLTPLNALLMPVAWVYDWPHVDHSWVVHPGGSVNMFYSLWLNTDEIIEGVWTLGGYDPSTVRAVKFTENKALRDNL